MVLIPEGSSSTFSYRGHNESNYAYSDNVVSYLCIFDTIFTTMTKIDVLRYI